MKITINNTGLGKEVNPYNKLSPTNWSVFDNTHPALPVIDKDGNSFVLEDEWEVELVYKGKISGDIIDSELVKKMTTEFEPVYRLSTPKEMNTTNNNGPGDDKSNIETLEEAAEKYYWSDEAQVSVNSLDRINDAFIAGANWQKSQSGLVQKAKVVGMIESMINIYRQEIELCIISKRGEEFNKVRIKLLTAILNQINSL